MATTSHLLSVLLFDILRGEPLFTPAALGGRAEGYQPQLSGQGEMAKWVLRHMDGSRTVADLAAGLVRDLGHPNPRQVETFVRHLIDGFGE